ncbi:MAG: cytochrome bc complex cytochrome b subunit [Desulfobacterota bacterium]|nr:cytochrome bc complex cytochrome b subunit [Thermodesulfobacteriota bacterium]MDW8002432.1 cytochrome bc complex cytochrome b subunit [Deltaproteobacteria bacterium]
MNCQKVRNWFSERYDFESLKWFFKKKYVPSHRYEIFYYFGGLTLFLFALQFLTGFALALYYVPHPEHANKSVMDIITKLNFGWLFRSLHHWGAQLLIGVLFFHCFTTLLLKSYRKPRELIWVSGVLLLGITIFFGLSGYLLIWDERAFAAVRVATGGAGSLPLFGEYLKVFLRGGADVTGETLTRFYAFHVCILPLITVFLVVFHIALVQFHGMSVPLSLEGKRVDKIPFFPNVFLKDLMIWLIFLGILVTLSVLFPPSLGKKADPYAPPPENIKPEWYFLFLFQTLKIFPGEVLGLNGETVAVTLVTLAILFFLLIPFFDRKSSMGEKSPVYTAIGTFYLVYFIVMTILGFVT